jgi:outer membrane protein TolC
MTPIRRRRDVIGAFLLSAALSAFGAPSAIPESGSPLTIDEAVRRALQNNPDIQVEAYAPEIARANVLAALGQFDPALNFGRSYTRSYGYPSVPGPLAPTLVDSDSYSLSLTGAVPTGLTYTIGGTAANERGPYNNFAGDYMTFGGVNLTQPLLRGFGFAANLVNVRVARANRSISEWQYRQTMIDTVTNVIVAYNELVLANDNLRIARRYRELGATLLTENLQRLKAGSGSQSDVVTARAQVASREEGILEAENTVRATDNQLRELMGEKSFPPDGPLLLVEAPPVPAVSVDPARDYQEALNRRPDYQAARLGITINRANSAAARNGLLPQVNLIGSYGYNGLASTFAASRQMVANRDVPSSAIGINLSIPITNARARGLARAARLTLEQSEASLKDLEAQIAVSVANSASQIETSRKRVIADQAAYDLANQALAGEEKKLSIGTSTPLAVVQDQTSLAQVEDSLANARFSERQAAAVYDQQLGMTLVRNHIAVAEDK